MSFKTKAMPIGSEDSPITRWFPGNSLQLICDSAVVVGHSPSLSEFWSQPDRLNRAGQTPWARLRVLAEGEICGGATLLISTENGSKFRRSSPSPISVC